MDRFEIKAVDLRDVQKVTVGHDGKGAGAGWLLEKIIVHDPNEKDKPVVFYCNQ